MTRSGRVAHMRLYEEGFLGIEVLDHQPGAYRFRRGAAERVKRVKAEDYAMPLTKSARGWRPTGSPS